MRKVFIEIFLNLQVELNIIHSYNVITNGVIIIFNE